MVYDKVLQSCCDSEVNMFSPILTRSRTRLLKKVYIKRKNCNKLLTWEEFLGEDPWQTLNLNSNNEEKQEQVKKEALFPMPAELYNYYIKNYVGNPDENPGKIKLILERSKTTIIDLTLDDDEIENIVQNEEFNNEYTIEINENIIDLTLEDDDEVIENSDKDTSPEEPSTSGYIATKKTIDFKMSTIEDERLPPKKRFRRETITEPTEDANTSNNKRKMSISEDEEADESAESSSKEKNTKPTRKKRDSQKLFRHPSLEFFRLGNSDNSTTLCKTKIAKEKLVKPLNEQPQPKNIPTEKLVEDIINTLGTSKTKHNNLPPVIQRETTRKPAKKDSNIPISPGNIPYKPRPITEHDIRNMNNLSQVDMQLQEIQSRIYSTRNLSEYSNIQPRPVAQEVPLTLNYTASNAMEQNNRLSNTVVSSPMIMEQQQILHNITYNYMVNQSPRHSFPNVHNHQQIPNELNRSLMNQQIPNHPAGLRPMYLPQLTPIVTTPLNLTPPNYEETMMHRTLEVQEPKRTRGRPPGKKQQKLSVETKTSNKFVDQLLTPPETPVARKFPSVIQRKNTIEEPKPSTSVSPDVVQVKNITYETISRMKSLFCSGSDNDHINETLESFNEQVINSYKVMFLEICQDQFVKQLLTYSEMLLQRFICTLLSKNNQTTKSWNVTCAMTIKSTNKELNHINKVKDECKSDCNFVRNHFDVEITNISSQEDVLSLNDSKGPTIIVMLDRCGNFVKTIYPDEQNFESITNLELLIVDHNITTRKTSQNEAVKANLVESYNTFKTQNQDTINFNILDNKMNQFATNEITSDELVAKIQSTIQQMSREDQIKIYRSIQNKTSTDVFTDMIDVPQEHRIKHSLKTKRLESTDSGIVSSTTIKFDGVEEISDSESEKHRITVKKLADMKPNIPRSKSVETISSTDSESTKTNKLKFYKRLPKGKLCYVREQNALFRYYDEAQQNLFIENLRSSNKTYIDDIYRHYNETKTDQQKEVIHLPQDIEFSNKETLDDAEEYVKEYNTVQRNVPQDFFWYYKYVTGYQIYRGNIPISFQTFLAMHNTNGLKLLFNGYLENLERQFKQDLPD